MDVKDKVILALGDSITAAQLYLGYLKGLSGAKEVVNYGIGGTTIAKRKKLLGNEYDKDFIGRVSEMRDKADVVLVFGGTNDYGHGDVPIGKASDETEDTFCGCVNILTKSLQAKYPLTKIVFITPLQRVGQDNPFGEGGRKSIPYGTLSEYVCALKNVVSNYGLPIFDLYTDKDFALDGPYFGKYICEDGLHPTDKGHRLIAEKIYDFLRAL